MDYYGRWSPYVPVAKRRANAAREAKQLTKGGRELRPIQIQSRTIATSFWGRAWCDNLENYADWENRMPRGRTYARNGSIVDLQIEPGKIRALVSGSSLYKIQVSISPLDAKRWKAIRSDCARQVSSLLDLLRGKLPDAVLARLTDPEKGLFPSPGELKLKCSCPDYATMCKHVAATLYGVGHLLDTEPELFFKMRGVDQSELVSAALATQTTDDAIGLNQPFDIDGEDLGAIFGIDLATSQDAPTEKGTRKRPNPARKRAAAVGQNPKSKTAKAAAIKIPQAAVVTKGGPGAKTSAPVKRGRTASASTIQRRAENTAQKPLGNEALGEKGPRKKTTSQKAVGKKATLAKASAKAAPSKKAVSKKAVSKKAVSKKAPLKKVVGQQSIAVTPRKSQAESAPETTKGKRPK